MQQFGIGEMLPDLTVDLVDGGSVDLPTGLDGRWKVVIFYRGHW